MSYAVKEIYYTLQGEGAQAGHPAVFCRFVGCNLWTGRERDRERAICQFCDTDFVGVDGPGGGSFATPGALASAIAARWPGESPGLVVFTGGEPLLQLDAPLIDAVHAAGLRVAIETNGTLDVPHGVDWVCVSPKAGADLRLRRGHELKLVFPQPGAPPDAFEDLEFEHFFLQPMDGPDRAATTRATIDYCLKNPRWRLSLQTHKLIGIP